MRDFIICLLLLDVFSKILPSIKKIKKNPNFFNFKSKVKKKNISSIGLIRINCLSVRTTLIHFFS